MARQEFKIEISATSSIPKYRQIINSLVSAIEVGILQPGEKIPSINEISEIYLLARDTVEKAYNDLRKKGVIFSVPGKGYFINEVKDLNKIRVFLAFNKLSDYKKKTYQSFIKTLGEKARVDLYIHHNEIQTLDKLINENLGKYHYYVIVPLFYPMDEETTMNVLRKIPEGKLILLDRLTPNMHFNPMVNAVYEDFENNIFYALEELLSLLKKYRGLNLIFPHETYYPQEIPKGFKTFCKTYSIPFTISEKLNSRQPKKNEAYLVIEESDLVQLLKSGMSKKMKPGKDFGIISYNEEPLKEILANGITVISTSFEKMGETAAQLILENKVGQISNPFHVFLRKSL